MEGDVQKCLLIAKTNIDMPYEIWGFHSGENLDGGLLGYDAM
jgi:hypothetical protein